MSKKGKIGIIGSGFIGSSWAMLFADVGYEVKLYDVDEEQLSSSLERILAQLEKLSSMGMLRGKLTPAQQFSLIEGVTSLEACIKDAKYVQECVFENLDLKIKVFKEIDTLASPNTILASSTSCIEPSKFTANLKNKSNCIVAHPVNPPYHVPLVEIVPAPWTSQDVVQRTRDLMEEIGQSPVVLSKELPGFALNRIQYAILNECFNLAKDGILSTEDIDKCMTHGLAYRYLWMGPLETAHTNAPKGFEDYIIRYGSTIERVSKSFKETPIWSVENGKSISDELEKNTPIEELKKKVEWREERLIAVAMLKKEMALQDSS